MSSSFVVSISLVSYFIISKIDKYYSDSQSNFHRADESFLRFQYKVSLITDFHLIELLDASSFSLYLFGLGLFLTLLRVPRDPFCSALTVSHVDAGAVASFFPLSDRAGLFPFILLLWLHSNLLPRFRVIDLA